MSRCWWLLSTGLIFVASADAASKAAHRSPKSPLTADKSLVPVWNTTLPVPIFGGNPVPQAVYGAPLAFLTGSAAAAASLVGVNPSTGAVEYSRPTGGFGWVHIYDSTVFIMLDGETLQAFDRSSGVCRWGCGGKSPTAYCSVYGASMGGTLNFQATANVAYCPNYNNSKGTAGFNVTTGEMVWHSSVNVGSNIPCGPKSGLHRAYACVSTAAGVGAVDVDTGASLWTAGASLLPFVTIAASEMTLTEFTLTSWVWYDVTTGAVQASVPNPQALFLQQIDRFGLVCGTAAFVTDSEVECFNDQGQVVVKQPTYSYDSVFAMELISKDILIYGDALPVNATCVIQGVEVGSNKLLWSNPMPPGCNATVALFPPTLANFFAVADPLGVSLFVARTGAFMTRLEQPNITNVFVNDQAPGHLFVVVNAVTIASYRLQ